MKPIPIPGLKACWQERRLSDVTLLIIEKICPEEDPEVQPNKKARRQETRLSEREGAKHIIPSSKTLLAGQAEYFRTQLLSDLDDGATSDMSLIVDEGEADAALAVIKAMYMGIADDVPTAELVAMWKIADRLQAPTTAAMCVEALCTKDLDWNTALLVSGHPSIGHMTCSTPLST
jgi:hypothetical protein